MFVEVAEAFDEIRAGWMGVVADEEDRENEGDLTMATEFVMPEAINFIAKYGLGLICLTLNEEHGLKMVTVADLIRYRLQNERYIHRVAESVMPTEHGDFRMIAYESEVDGGESHIALVYGDLAGDEPVPVRVHTHCLAGDVF